MNVVCDTSTIRYFAKDRIVLIFVSTFQIVLLILLHVLCMKWNTFVANIYCFFFFSADRISFFWYTIAMIWHRCSTIIAFEVNSVFQNYFCNSFFIVWICCFSRSILNCACHFLLEIVCKSRRRHSSKASSICWSYKTMSASSFSICWLIVWSCQFQWSVFIWKLCSKIKQWIFLFHTKQTFRSRLQWSRLWTLFFRHTFVESFFCIKRICICFPWHIVLK